MLQATAVPAALPSATENTAQFSPAPSLRGREHDKGTNRSCLHLQWRFEHPSAGCKWPRWDLLFSSASPFHSLPTPNQAPPASFNEEKTFLRDNGRRLLSRRFK